MSVDDQLERYVQLQALQKSHTIIFTAFATVLQMMDQESRAWFCQSFQEQIQELLQSNGEDYSAHAELLGTMCRALFQTVLDQP